MDAWVQIVLGVLAAGPGTLALFLRAKERRAKAIKTEAEAVDVDAAASIKISTAWERLNMGYQKEITDLKSEVARLNKKVDRLERKCETFEDLFSGVHRLHNQVLSHGLQPVYNPPDRRTIDRELADEEGV